MDHCDAKGCSHKCSYNYDFEDYVCTCPRKLKLGLDGHTCEPRTDADPSQPGQQPPIEIAVIPTNCLWAQWSGWSKCSGTCGTAFRSRQRTVLLPARNGGKCHGGTVEKWQCNLLPCPGDETAVTPASTELASPSPSPRGLGPVDVPTTVEPFVTTTQVVVTTNFDNEESDTDSVTTEAPEVITPTSA